jgi:hypothetical protein
LKWFPWASEFRPLNRGLFFGQKFKNLPEIQKCPDQQKQRSKKKAGGGLLFLQKFPFFWVNEGGRQGGD